ncbi:Tkl protein kinase [Globisporangium polare]
MRALSLLALAALLVHLALLPTAAQAAAQDIESCTSDTNKAAYSKIQKQFTACEEASGVTMVLPLTSAQKQVLCNNCAELKQAAQQKTAPQCTVVIFNNQTIRLRQQLNRFFKPCLSTTSSDSDSGSSSSASASGTAAATTTTTTATPTTKSPTATTKAPAATSSGSSASNNSTSSTTKKPDSDSGSSATQTSNQSESSSISTGLIIGVIAGGVAVALVAIIFILLRKKRRNSSSDKLEDSASLNSSTGRASTMHYQFSLLSGGTGFTGGSKSSSNKRSSYQPSPQVNMWEDEVIVASRIPKDKVMPTVLLSRGGFGEVYQGIYNRQTVAIKTLLPEHRKNMKQINAFLYEVKLMASLEHERIVNFVGVAWDSLNDVCVVSEYMEGGDLRGVLVKFEEMGHRHGFDTDKIKIALHVAHALTYLHSLRPEVLHRDLKSKNILLDSQLNAKLTDFGVSRERSDTTTMTAGVGTSLWMAPEVMMGERYDVKADIFSFGIVLSELDTHSVPYGNVKETESGRRIPDSAVLQMVSLGRLRVKFTTVDTIPEMVELGNACVAVNPKDRPGAADVLYTLHNILKSMFRVM